MVVVVAIVQGMVMAQEAAAVVAMIEMVGMTEAAHMVVVVVVMTILPVVGTITRPVIIMVHRHQPIAMTGHLLKGDMETYVKGMEDLLLVVPMEQIDMIGVVDHQDLMIGPHVASLINKSLELGKLN